MPILFLVLMTFSISNSSYANESTCGSIKPQWLECAAAKDCVVISDPCGWPKAAANKKFAEAAQKVNQCAGAVMSCPAWEEKRDGKWIADCKKQVCAVAGAPHSPQAECESKGGRWEGSISGRGRLTGCNMPTKDSGKACAKAEDCESVCTLDKKCYGWQMFKGCAFFKGHDQSMCVE